MINCTIKLAHPVHRWAIVGVSSQLVLGQVTRERYQEEIGSLTLHIGRLCPGAVDDETGSLQTTTSVAAAYTTATRVTAAKEYPLLARLLSQGGHRPG